MGFSGSLFARPHQAPVLGLLPFLNLGEDVLNLANVVTGPAPKIRAFSRPRQWLLVVWAAAVVYVFADMSRLAIAVAAYPMATWSNTGVIVVPGLATALVALIGWAAILGLVVWRIALLPGKLCRELAEYRTVSLSSRCKKAVGCGCLSCGGGCCTRLLESLPRRWARSSGWPMGSGGMNG